MKLPLLLVAATLVAACTTHPSSTDSPQPVPPSQCSIAAQDERDEGIYTSLVQAATMDEALRIALGNIANQIQVAIRSESESVSRKQGNQSVQSFQRRITGVSEFVFDDYEVLCQDFVHNEVLVQYDNRPLTERIRSKLESLYGDSGWELVGDPQLLSTPGLTAVNRSAGFSRTTLQTDVYRNRDGWRLAIGKHRFKLRDEEWRQLFRLPPSSRNTLSFDITGEFGNPLPHALYHEQEFRFRVQGELPAVYYLNLFYIDTTGKVLEVRANAPHSRPSPLSIPQKGIFTAELPEGFGRTVDDYVVIISSKPLERPASPWLFNGWLQLFSMDNAFGLRLTVR